MDKDTIIEYIKKTPANTNPAVLVSMVDSVSGNDLPPIESGDAGKVLTVNAGETAAEWATPSGGGGGLDNAVLARIYYDDHGDYVCDKTYTELQTAMNNDKCVLLMLEGYPAATAIILPNPSPHISAEFLTCGSNGQNQLLVYTHLTIQSDDSITENETFFTLTPTTP